MGGIAMSDEDEDTVVPVFVPALVALLIHAEELNGAPLTRNQVVAIRDNAHCIMVPAPVKADMEAKRGYADIDPERCWEEWLRVRSEIAGAKDG